MAVGIKTNNTNLENIKLYPNPNKGIFNISLDHKNETYQLEIYNSLGELVYQSMVINELLEINLEASPIGLYYVKLKGKEGNKTFKFIKE